MPVKPVKKSASKETDAQLASVEAQKNTTEQEIARVTHDLETLRSEKNVLQSSVASLKNDIVDFDRRIQRNDEILRAAPTLQRASEELAQIEIAIRALTKEQEFVQRKNDDIAMQLQQIHSSRSEKEAEIRQRDFTLSQMRKETNPARYDSVDAGKRVLVAELARSESEFRRFDEEVRKFQSRLYDIDTHMKRLIADQKLREQDVTVARRLEVIEGENQRMKRDVEKLRDDLREKETDLLKHQQNERRLEDRLRKAQADLTQVEGERVRAQRKAGTLD